MLLYMKYVPNTYLMSLKVYVSTSSSLRSQKIKTVKRNLQYVFHSQQPITDECTCFPLNTVLPHSHQLSPLAILLLRFRETCSFRFPWWIHSDPCHPFPSSSEALRIRLTRQVFSSLVSASGRSRCKPDEHT